MSGNLTPELRGFTRFLAQAGNELINWYGSYCNHDATKIAFMASKEWDGMADLERKPFIKSESNKNPFFNYLIQMRCNKQKAGSEHNDVDTFHPEQFKVYATDWKAKSDEEKKLYAKLDPSSLRMEHVIEKRNILHQKYNPRDLNIMEFMLKTKPKYPKSSRIWYLRTESANIKSAACMRSWYDLDDERKSLYERCAVLDSKRYALEKNAWVTKMVKTDLGNDEFTLTDFELTEIRSRIETLGSIVELSRDLPDLIVLKRPREPFSLFIEAFQYQIREQRPNFKFGPHLRACSEAWKKLNEEERQFYIEESTRLKEKRKKLLESETKASSSKLSVPVDMFSPDQKIFGPCRVSHLYPRLPKIETFWAQKNGITSRPIKHRWEELSDDQKEKYVTEYKLLKEEAEAKRREIDLKQAEIKRYLRDAKLLEAFKRDIGLLGKSTKPVKNIQT